MASIFGDEPGTGRGRRRPGNGGYPTYPPATPAPTSTTAGPRGGGTAGPRGSNPFPGSQGPMGDTPPVVPPSPDPEGPADPEDAPPTKPIYANIPGLDLGKLQRGEGTKYKYGPAAHAFSSFVGGGGKVGRNALDDLVTYAQTKFGLTKARVVGDDKIDFGDGAGPVDLILSDGGLWWGQEAPGGGGGSADPFTQAAGGSGAPGGGFGMSGDSSVDMSWLADLLNGLNPPPAPVDPAPPIVVNVPGQQPSYSQPSPSFGGGYVQPGFQPSGDGALDATSLLSLALPQLLKDPNAMSNPLVRQILQLMQGGA